MSNLGSSYKWDEWFGARRLETLRAHAPRVFPFKVSPARSEQLKQISKIIDKSKAIEAMEGSKYLLFWTKEHNYSTVSKTAIKSTNPGDRTEGKFMGKWYPCIVIGKESPKAEKQFRAFLNKTIAEEAAEDLEAHVLQYIKSMQNVFCSAPQHEITETPQRHGSTLQMDLETGIAQKQTTSVDGTALSKEDTCSESPFSIFRKPESLGEKRLRKLEDEVKYLKRKIRKLEERDTHAMKNTLGKTVEAEKLDKEEGIVVEAEQLDKKTDKVNETEKTVEETENKKAKYDELVVNQLRTDKEKFKYLVRNFFSEDELRSCSRTGKKSVKSNDSPRPPLNGNIFQELTAAVLKHTSFDFNTFVKKFENLQKILRR